MKQKQSQRMNKWMDRLQSIGRRLRHSVLAMGLAVAIAGIALPVPARAQLVIFDPQQVAEFIKEEILGGLETAAKVGIKNSIRSFTEKIAYDTAVWIGSGDANQKPLLYTKQAGEYLEERGDAALGEFLNTLASENGFAEFDLCNLPDGLTINLLIPELLGIAPYEPECKFSEIKKEFRKFSREGSLASRINFTVERGSLQQFREYLGNGENAIIGVLQATERALGENDIERQEATIERISSGFKDQVSLISAYIQTPAAIADFYLNNAIRVSTDGETIQQDNIVADTLTIFTSTLASKLLDRAAAGLLAFFSQPDIGNSLAGGSSTVIGGIREAQDIFAELITPSFNPGSEVDILSQFANCPEQGADVTNCVVDESLRLAIDEQMTLQEAVDRGVLDPGTFFGFGSNKTPIESPEGGISYRNIKILKQYSVVPVGWVLAAEYNRDFDTGPVTLGAMMDAYDNCSGNNYSPYCGLVDPYWTLKAPQVFCRIEGYGSNFLNQQFIDSDGLDATPDENFVSRLTSCLDAQTCLSEDDSGNCEAFGYCTQQRDIYRFEGNECPAYNASCETFRSPRGDDVSYLKNTLNYNDCSADNVGCQWNCTVYNEVEGQFQCASQDELYITCEDPAGCTATVSRLSGDACSSPCTVEEGRFSCDAEDGDGEDCIIGTISQADAGVNAAITLDDDVRTCSDRESGCTEFVPVAGAGNNLLANGSFETWDNGGTGLQTVGDLSFENAQFGVNAETAEPCQAFGDGGECVGWEKANATATRVVGNSADGTAALQFQDGVDTVMISRVDTGHPIANRTFTLSYQYWNPGADTCTGEYWIERDDGTGPLSLFGNEFEATYEPSTGFTQQSISVTFGNGAGFETDEWVMAGISAASGCELVIDSVSLTEQLGAPDAFEDYGQDKTYLNLSVAEQCSPDEVGCALYSPRTGESNIDIPGIITNPLPGTHNAGVCDDLRNPECSQCLEEFVGCEAFIEQETPYQAPLKDIGELDPAAVTPELAAAVASRTGFYCEGTTTACNPDRAAAECGAAACVPSTSLVPTTGQTCSPANVGCEEYTNLDVEAAGGEALEYYTYIRQCVKPTVAQESAGEIDTFYTFEGDDDTGYQIRAHLLKVSAVDAGPCTNLDLYGATSQSAEADCVDDTIGQQICDASDVGDGDCTQYFDSDGASYYRLQSATISVSDDCQPLRNSRDQRIYFSIPDESITCPAVDNGCREYKGSEGGNARAIIDSDFDDPEDFDVWSGAGASSEVLSANVGQSMTIGEGGSVGASSARTPISGFFDATDSLILTFWAKSDDEQTLTPSIFSFERGGELTFPEGSVELTTEWQQYTMGPLVFPADLAGDEEFVLEYATGPVPAENIAYIDNIELRRNNSTYLVQNSAESCLGYEGCEEYTDQNRDTHYLKSFERLCGEDKVGCQALINTQNSDSPFTQFFNTENDTLVGTLLEDNEIVGSDQTETWVVEDSALCSAEFAGCSFVGTAELTVQEQPRQYEGRHVVNDPDEYSTILCQEQQRSCEAWDGNDGVQYYFKDPGVKTCTFDEAEGKWVKAGGDIGADCPLQNPNVSPSQPRGPICDSGPRSGELCSTDSDCPTNPGEDIARCTSNVGANSGWAGSCEPQYAGCTAYVDPNTENVIDNPGFEADVVDNVDITDRAADGIPDEWHSIVNTDNFFVDAAGGGVVGCSSIIHTDEPQFAEEYSVQPRAGSNDHCMVVPLFNNGAITIDDTIAVDQNSNYTLRANVYATNADTEFAIGLLYYDFGGEISAGDDPEDYAIAAYEGSARTGNSMPLNQWVEFHAEIGPNLQYEFPEGTTRVLPFIEVTGSDDIYFDNVRLNKNEIYTYINDSVDGSAQNTGINTCNGEVSPEEGCVAFRDTTDESLNVLSTLSENRDVDPAYVNVACDFNSDDETQSCQSMANASDANVVVKVRRDRECSEWLTCADATEVFNAEGQLEEVICHSVARCNSRNPITGECNSFVPRPSSDAQLGANDDVSVISQPDNVLDVHGVSHHSGFSTVGGQWIGACIDNVCVGGSKDGESCAADASFCAEDPLITYGFYPYDWMPERGNGGGAVTDIVPDGDFEAVFCDGATEYDPGPDPETAGLPTRPAVQAGREKSQSCTLDFHCRTNASDAAAQTAIQSAATSRTVEDTRYWEGWCGNVDTRGWKEWDTRGDAAMSIIDYDATVDYSDNISAEGIAGGVAAAGLDLNNVLYVDPVSGASGAQVELADSIVPGFEYTLSFDAQYVEQFDEDFDFVEIGIAHNDGVDYFATGQRSVDLIFAVDYSVSMDPYIREVADNVSALVSGLDEDEIEYQIGIVGIGGAAGAGLGTEQVQVVDFDDYAVGGAGEFNADGTVTTPFTNSAAEFATVMNHIADNTVTGPEMSYKALYEIAENTFSDEGDYSYNYRGGSVKYVILITDEFPEEVDPFVSDSGWEEEDEIELIQDLGTYPYTLNTIANRFDIGDPADFGGDLYNAVAFNDVSEHLGGQVWDIDADDYDGILEAISDDIDRRTTTFRFSENYERYVLGPLRIINKTNTGGTAQLFIGQSQDSLGPAFVIDNVSLKPALEVNIDGNPHADNSTQLVSRTCRGYPDQDSEFCDYNDGNGAIYRGWKGYCLESDEYNPDACVTWWPVDVLTGEVNSAARQRIFYDGKTPVYHCLVAKGNLNPGVCYGGDNAGTMCRVDEDCESDFCIGGDEDLFSPDSLPEPAVQWNDDASLYTLLNQTTTDNYVITHTIPELFIDPNTHGSPSVSNREFATFHTIGTENLPLERSMHISEIDHIKFNIGQPDYDGALCDGADPNQSWRLGTGANIFNSQNLDGGVDGDGTLWEMGLSAEVPGELCGDGDNENGNFAYQYGWWCGGEPCALGDMENRDIEDVSFVATKAVIQSKQVENLQVEGGFIPNIDGEFQVMNPFHEFESQLKTGEAVKKLSGRIEEDGDNVQVEGQNINSAYFVSRFSEPAEDVEGCFGGLSVCGANIAAAEFVFDNGYLEAVNLIYWDGLRAPDALKMTDIEWQFFLKEPCLLFVEGANADAVATPWRTRISEGTNYYIQEIGYTYNLSETQIGGQRLPTAYGALVGQDLATPDLIDGEDHTASGNPTAAFTEPGNTPFVQLNSDPGSALPFACIGQCSRGAFCSSSDYGTAAGEEDYFYSQCDNDIYVGIHGICKESLDVEGPPVRDADGNAVVCGPDTECPGDSICTVVSGLDYKGYDGDADEGSYEDRLKNALSTAWDRYRLVYADVSSDTIYYAPENDRGGNDAFLTNSADPEGPPITFAGEDLLNDFARMEECGVEDRRELGLDDQLSRYCGVRPTIENMTINGNPLGRGVEIDVLTGSVVTLEFDSVVDPDQEPLQQIRVVWEGDGDDAETNVPFDLDKAQSVGWEAASTTGHRMTHTYICDASEELNYNADSGFCEFQVQVQLSDYWGWCSGNSATGAGPLPFGFSPDDYSTRETEAFCTSYDAFDALIRVQPAG